MTYVRDAAGVAGFVEGWLKERVTEAGARGIVVGLSGGVDSAVVAALGRRAFGRDMAALILPCHSDPLDEADARLVADTLDIPCERVDLGAAYDALAERLGAIGVHSGPALANLKARLRMATLYAVAQARSLLVCGTGNRAEIATGYFTKFGDSASDLLPLADLLKCEVRALAAHLGVPERIVLKAPSAGLWAGQTDEGEMGFSYDDLDRYLATGDAEPGLRERIEARRRNSEHKRRPVPVCVPEV